MNQFLDVLRSQRDSLRLDLHAAGILLRRAARRKTADAEDDKDFRASVRHFLKVVKAHDSQN